MRPDVVCFGQRWKLEAASMSEYMEMIDLSTMTGRLIHNGEVVSKYKMEQCDKCAQIRQLDKGGYVTSDPAENMVWFCKHCR